MTDKPHKNSTDSILRGIDRYSIQERIGTGGMARVYRAVDKALDRDVAVKVLHAYMADDETFRARFEREAKFLASFHHPNVVQIYDYATVEQADAYLCYMVMSYLPGRSLEAVMAENSENERLMSQDKVLRLAKDIAAALQYAHEMGMVHRDVKPANILFDAEGRAVLTDFGIARMVESSKLTQENVAIGTPAYMAPEQVAGEAVDNRTDVYAFGVILYELLTGHPPFGDDGSVSVLIKHLNEPVPAVTSFEHIDNQYLDDVLFKALAKKPDERYQTAIEFADDLEMALAGEQPTNTQIIKRSTSLGNAIRSPLIDKSGASGRITRQNSPLGILSIGLAVILVIVVAAFVVNAMNEPTIQAAPTEVAINGVDSMVAEPEDDLAPSMTSPENMAFVSDFTADDPLVGLYWTLESTVDEERPGMITRQMGEDGTYIFTNSIPGRAATTIAEDFYYTEDITILANLTLDANSPASSGYGLAFHYTSPNSYGVFAVDGNGNYSIWFLQGTDGWTELRNLPNGEEWSPDPNISPIGEPNNLRLEIRGAQLTGYVNDEQVVQVENDALTEGEVGLYLATPRTTEEAAIITDRYEVIVASNDNTASSMTSDSDSTATDANSQ